MVEESGLLGPREIRSLAAELDVAPTKKLGQNFVVDPNTVRKIVSLARLRPHDVVLEIGPGLGSLTLALLPQCAAVVAVEIDARLATKLPQTVQQFAPPYAAQLSVVSADAMTVDCASLGTPTAFVANLPYNVAVPVVLRVLSELESVASGLVMVQMEVAQRLAATPNSREYGIPSVKMAWFGAVHVVGKVSPTVFWPVPRVESGLVRFDRRPTPLCTAGRAEVFGCVDAAFSQRRKKLRSALANWAGSLGRADELLAAAGVDSAARAENLTLVDFIAIADARHAATTT
jgi:16S rRNA (adenine1518-N6/adenine1519-N6)-dimethyltransferase